MKGTVIEPGGATVVNSTGSSAVIVVLLAARLVDARFQRKTP